MRTNYGDQLMQPRVNEHHVSFCRPKAELQLAPADLAKVQVVPTGATSGADFWQWDSPDHRKSEPLSLALLRELLP
jgi:hypothetical protein